MSESESVEAVSVGQWIIYNDGWQANGIARVEIVTPQQVRVKRKWGGGLAHLRKTQVVFVTDSEDHCRKTAERLKSVRAESERRENAARAWLHSETAKIIALAAQVQA